MVTILNMKIEDPKLNIVLRFRSIKRVNNKFLHVCYACESILCTRILLILLLSLLLFLQFISNAVCVFLRVCQLHFENKREAHEKFLILYYM